MILSSSKIFLQRRLEVRCRGIEVLDPTCKPEYQGKSRRILPVLLSARLYTLPQHVHHTLSAMGATQLARYISSWLVAKKHNARQRGPTKRSVVSGPMHKSCWVYGARLGAVGRTCTLFSFYTSPGLRSAAKDMSEGRAHSRRGPSSRIPREWTSIPGNVCTPLYFGRYACPLR